MRDIVRPGAAIEMRKVVTLAPELMDILTPKQRSVRMALIRSIDSKFERAIRSQIHVLGYRYRLHVDDLPGKPDLVFPGRGKIVFLHSCFWHGHGCRMSRMPKSRLSYWIAKINSNRVRDRKVTGKLRREGWRVLVVWECRFRANAKKALSRLTQFLDSP